MRLGRDFWQGESRFPLLKQISVGLFSHLWWLCPELGRGGQGGQALTALLSPVAQPQAPGCPGAGADPPRMLLPALPCSAGLCTREEAGEWQCYGSVAMACAGAVGNLLLLEAGRDKMLLSYLL